jgi:hypothetical protein
MAMFDSIMLWEGEKKFQQKELTQINTKICGTIAEIHVIQDGLDYIAGRLSTLLDFFEHIRGGYFYPVSIEETIKGDQLRPFYCLLIIFY